MKTLPSLCASLLFILTAAPPAVRADDKDDKIASLQSENRELKDLREAAAKKRVELEDEIAALKKQAGPMPSTPEEAEALKNFTEKHLKKWDAAMEAAALKYASYGADDPLSTFSLLVQGVTDLWLGNQDARLDDPATAPETIFAEALTRLQALQSSALKGASGGTNTADISLLNIQLTAARNERAKLLAHIEKLTNTSDYERGWNECVAKLKAEFQPQLDAAYNRGMDAARLSAGGTTPATPAIPWSAFDKYEQHRAQMNAAKVAKAKGGSGITAEQRSAMESAQRAAAAGAADFERHIDAFKLQNEVRKLGR